MQIALYIFGLIQQTSLSADVLVLYHMTIPSDWREVNGADVPFQTLILRNVHNSWHNSWHLQ